MFSVESMMKTLLMSDGIYAAFIPTEEQVSEIFERESKVEAACGMPFHNLSLEESLKRRHHICIFQKHGMRQMNHHVLTMVNESGQIAGFDVPPVLKHEVEGRDDLIWMSEDFVLDPVTATGNCKLVMNPLPAEMLSDEGILDAIVMMPAAPVDEYLRDTFLIPWYRALSSAVISFNLDPHNADVMMSSISAYCYQTCRVQCY